MAKKRKSRHRVPVAAEMRSDPVDDRYQAEVDSATNRLQRRYERALKARDAARARLAKAVQANEKRDRLASLRRLVEIREWELAEVAKLMQPGNRSKVPWRPVPVTHQS